MIKAELIWDGARLTPPLYFPYLCSYVFQFHKLYSYRTKYLKYTEKMVKGELIWDRPRLTPPSIFPIFCSYVLSLHKVYSNKAKYLK